MGKKRLVRLLSAVLVPLGVVFLLLNVIIGDALGIGLGIATILLGVAMFRCLDQFWDTKFDLTKTPVVVNLVQLAAVLLVFTKSTYLLSDIERVTQAFRTGIPTPRYLAYAGLSMGVLLGGCLPYLLVQLGTTGQKLNEKIYFRTIGFSTTFGTFVILLVSQPSASGIYAAAYLSSRIAVLGGMYTLGSG